MAAARRSLPRAVLRDTGMAPVAAPSPSPSPGPLGAGEPELEFDPELESDPGLESDLDADPCLDADPDLDADPVLGADPELELEWNPWVGVESDEEPGRRSAVAVLLERCRAAGAVSQETLDLTCRRTPCFVKFSEMEKMVDLENEINEIKLKTEMMQLENETADITHHFHLGKKCEILQDMNRHLEAILKEKRALRKRLMKHRCQESLPIDATFHKCIVDLLTEAVTFIEKLESHLQSVRSIPQIPHMMNNMDTTLTKTEVLVIELEELTEQILKWEELQKEVYSNSVCNTADLDFGLSLT